MSTSRGFVRNSSNKRHFKLISQNKDAKKNAIGFCNNMIHRGWLSREVVYEHECLERRCLHFQRQPHIFWKIFDKEFVKTTLTLDEIEQRRIKISDMFKSTCLQAFERFNVYVTSIREDGHLIEIIYTAANRLDLRDYGRELGREFEAPVYFRFKKTNPHILDKLLASMDSKN